MRSTTILILALLLLAGTARAQMVKKIPPAPPEKKAPARPMPDGPRTFFKLQGGGVYQPDTGMDGDGEFSVERFFVQPGLDMFLSRELQLSFGLGYSFDRYEFSGKKGLAGLDPWGNIDSLQFAVLARYALDETWTLFGAPAVRVAAERGAELTDGATAGFYGGAAIKTSETFSIGPGFGFFTEIEDRGVFFPFLLIDWQIADNLALRTGRGVAATRGPGLVLAWDFADRWAAEVGGRWEQLRFRLDDEDIAPDGVGEEESVPLFAALTYRVGRQSTVSLLGGVNFYGSVSVFDDRGDKLRSEDYDPAPFVGLVFSVTF